ncbi:hypothetical protein ACFL21_00055 [Patescibacteria group bacterium]
MPTDEQNSKQEPDKTEEAKAPQKDEATMPTLDEDLVNPLDEKKEAKAYDSEVLKTVVDTETSEGPEQILEAAPEVDTSLLEDLAPTKSLTLMTLKILFAILMGYSLVAIIFFTSQLSNKLDFAVDTFGVKNVSAQLAATNTEVLSLQTNLNFFRYLQYKSFLDHFSFYGDSYVQYYDIANSQTSTSTEKKDAIKEMESLREKIREAFMFSSEFAAAQFSVPLIDPTIENLDVVFIGELKNKIGDRVREFDELQGEDIEAGKTEKKNYMQTLNLVGNTSLTTLLINTDFDALTETELYSFIKTVNSLILNDMSIIQDIKNNRVRWSDVMQEIELKTIAVDKRYEEDFYDQIGGVRYSSYDFDNENQRITIVGETKRFDTTNFTMIAKLIDSLNSSELFGNSEMRSFTKSGSLEEGYIASLRLTLDLDRETVTEMASTMLELAVQNGATAEDDEILSEDEAAEDEEIIEEEIIEDEEIEPEEEEIVEEEIIEDEEIEPEEEDVEDEDVELESLDEIIEEELETS